jgi:O-antigen/teichoic acid export membrane protein
MCPPDTVGLWPEKPTIGHWMMSTQSTHSVSRNATVLLGSQAVTWVSSFVLMVFLPRYLGSEEYGRLYLAMSLALMTQVFIDFGGAFYIAKEIAKEPDNAPALIADSIGLRIFLSLVALLALLAFAVLGGYPPRVQLLIAILSVAKLWEGSLAVYISSFQGFERMEFRSASSITERVVLTASAVPALLLGADAVLVAVLMALSTLASFAVASRFIRRLVPKIPRIRWRSSWRLARAGLPYLLMAIFAVIYYRINAVMLSLLTTEAVVGWFGAAFRFFDILMFLPSILSVAVFPVLARQAGEKANVADTAEKSLRMILLAGVPMSIGTYAFSSDIIGTLFGLGGYAASIPVLKVLAPGLLLVYVDFVLVTALVALDRQRQWSIVALIAIPVSVALNYLFIPWSQLHYGNGGIGSALATNVTELLIMGAAILLMPGGILGARSIVATLKAATAGACMVIAVWGLNGIPLFWMLKGSIAMLVYCLVMVVLGGFEETERRLFRDLVSGRIVKRAFIGERRTDP